MSIQVVSIQSWGAGPRVVIHHQLPPPVQWRQLVDKCTNCRWRQFVYIIANIVKHRLHDCPTAVTELHHQYIKYIQLQYTQNGHLGTRSQVLLGEIKDALVLIPESQCLFPIHSKLYVHFSYPPFNQSGCSINEVPYYNVSSVVHIRYASLLYCH